MKFGVQLVSKEIFILPEKLVTIRLKFLFSFVFELNESNLNDHTEEGVSVIDFWAPWCGPCKMLTPIMEKVSEHYSDNSSVVIGKVNVDEEVGLAGTYGITAVPTLVFLKDGEVVKTVTGVQPQPIITEAIDTLLGL